MFSDGCEVAVAAAEIGGVEAHVSSDLTVYGRVSAIFPGWILVSLYRFKCGRSSLKLELLSILVISFQT